MFTNQLEWKLEKEYIHNSRTNTVYTHLFLDFQKEERKSVTEREISFLKARQNGGGEKFSPFQLLRVLDLVPDGAGQAVRGLLPAPIDPPVLQIELVLRYILRAAVVAPSVLQYRFATSLIRVMLRARAYSPIMLERWIIHAEYLIANRDAPLRQFLARPVRPSAHVHIHISRARESAGEVVQPTQDRVFVSFREKEEERNRSITSSIRSGQRSKRELHR